ncbi:hypothetical protein QWY87_10565 [Lutimonas halocynthiae]|uniref:hypothetical protein n=1 Tax=Lutimonas halocynthiae TaxID=1446477 RepID=UPI0025B5C43B|nr:hypothetical protein [Lutimonas halocynthiae]MDN3643144.1 hypothetical protein [Lutimonas halocynthiae]
MKKIVLILTVLLILSCDKQTNEIRYYPSYYQVSKDSVLVIGLDTVKLNFRQITNEVETYSFDNGYGNLFVEFDDGQIKKRITPFVYGAGLIREKNGLTVTDDSIYIDDGYPISDLKWILKRHYLNKGKIPHHSSSPKNAFVEMLVDTNMNGVDIKKVLTKITRSFDEVKKEINDTIELHIYFYNIKEVKPPPPLRYLEQTK